MLEPNTNTATNADGTQATLPVTDELAIFKEDMKQLLRGALNLPNGHTGHMIKYDYSSVVPPGSLDSGADMWDRVTLLGVTSNYYITTAEGKIVHQNMGYFTKLFAESPAVIDLGPGGNLALDLKSIPTFKAVGGKSYIPIDINEAFAINAADAVHRKNPSVPAAPMHADFTKPRSLNVESPILMMMYGCTLSQFPFSKQGKDSEVTLGELLVNLGDMVDYKGIMVATIDTNTNGPSARNCYTGLHFEQFKRHLWLTAKALIETDPSDDKNYVSVEGNRNANPAHAVVYDPRFEGDGIVHSFFIKKQMTFVIDGERFDIPRGTQIDTGFSKKWSAADVAKAAKKAGWDVVNELIDGQSTVRALVLAGKNVSADQKARAAGKTITAPSRLVPVVVPPPSAEQALASAKSTPPSHEKPASPLEKAAKRILSPFSMPIPVIA